MSAPQEPNVSAEFARDSAEAEAVAPAEPIGSATSPVPDRTLPLSLGAESEPRWPDEAAEAAFISEARERGDTMVASTQVMTALEEADGKKNLPALDDLLQRIPADVRETLDELFRAKFVAVRRIPKKALEA